jgi:histone H3/H4
VRLSGCAPRRREFKHAELVPYVAAHFVHLCTGPDDEQVHHGGYSVSITPEALEKFRAQQSAQARARCVNTTISVVVCESLAGALRLNRFICIEGPPGFGKSYAAEAWTEQNLHAARYVRLRGITNKAGFFYTVLERLGFTGIEHSGPDKLQRMLQNFLRASRLMLVIDEAQNLLPAKECSKKRPELLDWLAGETFDSGLPCSLLTWADFTTRRAAAEQSTSWRAEHLSRRLRYERLATPPTKVDFLAVARALLPDADTRCHKLSAAYAALSRHHMQALTDVIAEAKDLAALAKRKSVTFEDVDAAVSKRAISDAAQTEALVSRPARSSRSLSTPTPAAPLPDNSRATAPAAPRVTRSVTPAEEVTT